MPFWCFNRLTVLGPTEFLDRLEKCSFDFKSLVPRPLDADEYEWNSIHWGVKWPARNVSIKYSTSTVLTVSFETVWLPPFTLLKTLLQEPGSWMKLEWTLESGLNGLWIAYFFEGELQQTETTWQQPVSKV